MWHLEVVQYQASNGTSIAFLTLNRTKSKNLRPFKIIVCLSVDSDPAIGRCNIGYSNIGNSNLAKSCSPIIPISVVKWFRNFAQNTTMTPPCSVQNFKTIWQLRKTLLVNEISRDLSFGWISEGVILYCNSLLSCANCTDMTGERGAGRVVKSKMQAPSPYGIAAPVNDCQFADDLLKINFLK